MTVSALESRLRAEVGTVGHTPPERPVDILLVEDSPGDVRLTAEALRDAPIPNRLHHAEDGVEALAFLRREAPFAAAPRPDIILLDLNLPRLDGREVLSEIKTDARLRSIPLVVLTTSEALLDVQHSYALHANCYVVKPLDLERFMAVVSSIEDFWFGVVKLPSSPDA